MRSIVALLLFGHYYHEHNSIIHGQSFAFASFAVNSMIYIFAYRSMRRPLHRSGLLSRNKPLVLQQWGVVFGIAFSLLIVVEIGKFISNSIIAKKQ